MHYVNDPLVPKQVKKETYLQKEFPLLGSLFKRRCYSFYDNIESLDLHILHLLTLSNT